MLQYLVVGTNIIKLVAWNVDFADTNDCPIITLYKAVTLNFLFILAIGWIVTALTLPVPVS